MSAPEQSAVAAAGPARPEPGARQRTTVPGARTGGPPRADSYQVYAPPRPVPPPAWVLKVRSGEPGPIPAAALWAALATALLAAVFLNGGIGLNLLIVAVPATVAAAVSATAAGRRARPWTLVWAAGGLALLSVPALRDAEWPTFLAMVAAFGLGSLALHGGRTWVGSLLGTVGVLWAFAPGLSWAVKGLRERARPSKDRWWPIARAVIVAVVLLVVFGALFAGADAAFADLLGGLSPDVSVVDAPLRVFFFVLGLLGALAAARTAVRPLRWDRIEPGPGKARGRLEWALPLVFLNALFAVFNAVQLAVLFGGYDKVLESTGLTYAQYARQGFWQLLWATLLTLLVIAVALRWAPRGAARDRVLVRSLLGLLCGLTLVVVASALRRMDLYVDAYGLTRLRLSVAGVEILLGLVLVLIMAAGVFGAGRWLPRAVLGTAAAGVLAFGLISPDGLVAGQNVDRFDRTNKIDLEYLRDLSADAAPALDRLPEPQRSCALGRIASSVEQDDSPWYAVSLGVVRARAVLDDRPLVDRADACERAGLSSGYRDPYERPGDY